MNRSLVSVNHCLYNSLWSSYHLFAKQWHCVLGPHRRCRDLRCQDGSWGCKLNEEQPQQYLAPTTTRYFLGFNSLADAYLQVSGQPHSRNPGCNHCSGHVACSSRPGYHKSSIDWLPSLCCFPMSRRARSRSVLLIELVAESEICCPAGG